MRLVVAWLVVLVGCSDSTSPESSAVRFEEVAAEAGLTYVQSPPIAFDGSCEGMDPGICIGRILTGGATVGDADGDGLPDLFVTELDGPDHLYRNRGDGTFEDVTDAAGLGGRTRSNGGAFGDIDDDGDLDLVVLTLGDTRHRLYVNAGDGTFAEGALARGASVERPELPLVGMSACFGDVDRDGWIDLHVNEWRPAAPNDAPDGTRLLRNRGESAPGHFEDVTESAGVSMEPFVPGFPGRVMAFTSSFTDFDEDGWPDLTIVADFEQTRLFWNRGDGTFESGNETLGAGVPSDENGMGIAVADFDRDGRLDWFVSSLSAASECDGCGWHDSGNRLYRATESRGFEEVTDAWGVREGGWGWGTFPFDYDHDGDPDLVMTNGYRIQDDRGAAFLNDPMRAWRNDGDRMSEISSRLGLTDTGQGRALVAFDYDGDGDQDLFIARHQDTPLLYRRDGVGGHYLRVRAEGRGAREGGTNRRGLGARVELVAESGDVPQKQQIGGCGFLGQSEHVAHFGVGDRDRVAVLRVVFPVTGQTVELTDVPTDQELVVREP